MNHARGEQALPPRSTGLLPILLLALLVPVFLALGIWQVQRLSWKQALIAQVHAAMTATPLPLNDLPPGPLDGLAYRRVSMQGRFDPAGTVLVTGTSSYGSGYWVLAPLRSAHGDTVYVNRGFVPVGSRLADQRTRLPTKQVSVIGLLRLSEPKGTMLRANQPLLDRWYSRDVAAIALTHRVRADPRLFVDAQVQVPTPNLADPAEPVPGLTVVAFANNHLGYALTWFTMALLCAGTAGVLWRKRS